MAKKSTPTKTKKSPPKKKTSVKPLKKATTKKKVSKKPVKKKAKKAKRKPETLMCFLTTACVNYYALPDDGYELTTLRNYRDTYLLSTEEGRHLVKNYYEVSPALVTQIENDKNRKSIYAYIYGEIKSSCAAIEKKQFKRAKTLYSTMVKTLQEKYN